VDFPKEGRGDLANICQQPFVQCHSKQADLSLDKVSVKKSLKVVEEVMRQQLKV
jgi:hypothetical protein